MADKWEWVIRVPMLGSDQLVDLCRCKSPEAASEVIRALAATAGSGPERIQIECRRVLE